MTIGINRIKCFIFVSMRDDNALYMDVESMEPMMPEDTSGKLEKIATEIIHKAGRLSGALHPITSHAIAEFLRPMNSYYSNLIEGHDTHPIDIDRALKNDFSKDSKMRNLQLEARAHIMLFEEIQNNMHSSPSFIALSSEYIKNIHKGFYEHLPDEFKEVLDRDGKTRHVISGEFRTDEVEVGRHIAPYSGSLDSMMNRFENFYNPVNNNNKSKIKRIIQIAASHHRLVWIHPFLDGNGRVVRLLSDACFMYEDIDADGLWSISRGLARFNTEYKARLANADMRRLGDYDGRGNLSNKMLIEFCEFFLKIVIDQIDYMYSILDLDHMLQRIERFTDLMVSKDILRIEAKFILTDVFLKGKITKSDAMRITNLSDKTLKNLTDKLIELELLEAKKEGIQIYYYVKYPMKFSPYLFTGLYPKDKELQMLQ